MVDESMSIYYLFLPKFLKYMKTATRLITDFTTHMTSALHFLNSLECAKHCKKFKYRDKCNGAEKQ